MQINILTLLKRIILLLFIFQPVDKVFSQDTTDCSRKIENILKEKRKIKKQKIIIKGFSTDIIEGKKLMNLVFTFSQDTGELTLVEFLEVDESNRYENFNVFWFKNDSLLSVRYLQLHKKTKAWGNYFFDNGTLCYHEEKNIPVQDITKFINYSKTFLTKSYEKLKASNPSGR